MIDSDYGLHAHFIVTGGQLLNLKEAVRSNFKPSPPNSHSDTVVFNNVKEVAAEVTAMMAPHIAGLEERLTTSVTSAVKTLMDQLKANIPSSSTASSSTASSSAANHQDQPGNEVHAPDPGMLQYNLYAEIDSEVITHTEHSIDDMYLDPPSPQLEV